MFDKGAPLLPYSGAPALEGESPSSAPDLKAAESKHHHHHRLSLFTIEGERDLKLALGEPRASLLLDTGPGVLFQVLLFLFLVLLGGLEPLVVKLAVQSSSPTAIPFNPFSVNIVQFSMSALLCFAWTVFAERKKQGRSCVECTKICFNPISVVLLSPVALTLAVTEATEFYVLKLIDASVKGTIQQSKLPISALLNRFVVRRSQTHSIQWTVIMAATAAILGFTFRKNIGNGGPSKVSLLGVALALGQTTVATSGLIITELIFLKGSTISTPIRITQLRTGAAIIACGAWAFNCHLRNTWHFFEGWNALVWVIMIWDMVKDWMVILLVKRMGNLWRAVASSVALTLTFICDSIINRDADAIASFFVALLLLQGLSLSLAKASQSQK